jgi:hypothetical protein
MGSLLVAVICNSDGIRELETPLVIDVINTGGKCRYRLIGLIKLPNA